MLFIWIFFLLSLLIFGYIIWYFFGENIKGWVLRIRSPQRVIKLLIHYPGGYYRTYWRLIPDDHIFKIDKKLYLYDQNVITKDHEFYVATGVRPHPMILVVKDLFTKTIKGKEFFHIGDTEEYEFNKMFMIKERFSAWPELHYVYNAPQPLDFNVKTDKVDFSSASLAEFHETDMIGKLLRLKYESMMMIFLIVLIFANLGITLFMLSKMMGWVK
jgi:hypothetical protein